MLPETAYTKLLWAAGQSDNVDEIRKIMQTNRKGEMDTTLSENFVNVVSQKFALQTFI